MSDKYETVLSEIEMVCIVAWCTVTASVIVYLVAFAVIRALEGATK